MFLLEKSSLLGKIKGETTEMMLLAIGNPFCSTGQTLAMPDEFVILEERILKFQLREFQRRAGVMPEALMELWFAGVHCCLGADQALSCDSGVSRTGAACEDQPAPVVVTVLALLRAPSPLVVYAATVME